MGAALGSIIANVIATHIAKTRATSRDDALTPDALANRVEQCRAVGLREGKIDPAECAHRDNASDREAARPCSHGSQIGDGAREELALCTRKIGHAPLVPQPL